MRGKSYRQIEASRNRRLWITNVILPVVSTGALVFTTLYSNNLEFRYYANSAANKVKNFFTKPKEK